MIFVPLRTRGGMNAREHHHARARRVKAERETVAWALRTATRPALPCVVRLTRIGPSNGLDDDNLASSLKSARERALVGID